MSRPLVGAALIGGLLVAGCSSSPPPRKPTPMPVSHAPVRPVPVGSAPVAQTPVRSAQAEADMCKANDLQWLVGKSKSQIPVPVDVVNRRVACTTCPVTQDYSPYRLNIFFNAQTDVVEQVRCG